MRREEVRADGRADRGEEPREAAESRELREHSLHHRATTRAERTQHGALIATLVATRLHRGQEHREPGEQREHEHALHRERRLVEHRAHLCEELVDVEDRHAREAVRELRKRAGRPGREIRARQVGAGGTLQHPGGEHDEEVRLKGVPLHLANARHPRLERLARDVEGQPIPDLDAERFLEFGGERHQGLPEVLRGPPAAGDDAVVGPELGRPGEVLLAGGEALLAAVPRAQRLDGATVDGGQSSADHRQYARGAGALRLEEAHEVLAHRGRDVDEEVIRKIRRQGALPVAVQIVAQDRQQQQRHDAGAEGHQLHHALGAPPAQVRDAKAPRDSDPAAQPPGERHEREARERESQDEDDERGGEIPEEPRIGHHPVDEQQHHAHRGAEGQQHHQRRRAEVAPQHAQRRHACQLQQRRQGETGQHRDRGHEADGERREARGRELRNREESADGAQQPLLGEESQRGTAGERGEREREQLQHGHRQREAAGRAECLEERHRIQMPAHVGARRHGDRDRAQEHAHQARETQETPGALHRVADLRARLGNVAQPLARALVGGEPGLEVVDARALAREQTAIAHAAAWLDQVGRRQIGGVHEEIGRELGERAALVGPGDQHLRHGEACGADREL